jgi:hypothetical protein
VSVRVCVRARVRACVRVCVRACVCVCVSESLGLVIAGTHLSSDAELSRELLLGNGFQREPRDVFGAEKSHVLSKM